MKKNKTNDKKIANNRIFLFFKTNSCLLLLIGICLIFLYFLTSTIITNYLSSKQTKQQIDDFSQSFNSLFSISKIQLYSSADAKQKSEGKAIWDLEVSQFTDIAISLQINNLNYQSTTSSIETTAANTVEKLYIDHIKMDSSYNTNLSYLPISDFGKRNLELSATDSITYEIFPNQITDFSVAKIDTLLSIPITLRYKNIARESCTITNIQEPVVFNGSLLKRCLIPLSSLKNTIYFDIHIINRLQEHYMATVTIDIPLQDETTNKSIYDGNFSLMKNQTIPFRKQMNT